MLPTVFWILVKKEGVDLEAVDTFLSPAERQFLASLRFEKRRKDWLLGRRATKGLAHELPEFRGHGLAEIEIRTQPEGAPYISLQDGDCPPHSLSISHSGDLALCALTLAPGLRIGADLEKVEPRLQGFVEDYFTAEEQAIVRAAAAERRDRLITLGWSLKEAMLKALGVGLRWDTRKVEAPGLKLDTAAEEGNSWKAIQVRDHGQEQRGWTACWCERNGFVLAAAGCTQDATGPGELRMVEMDPGR